MKSSMLAIFLLSTILCSGQTIKVKAEQGDGIFSLLRKQGLNPGKYYVDFIQLNEALIKNGSELSLGVEYQIPDAPDSYRKTALEVSESPRQEEAIFNAELASINSKSTKLNNAVVYLVPGMNGVRGTIGLKAVRNEILKGIAKELMVHGAKIYLVSELDSVSNVSLEKKTMSSKDAFADQNHMEHFVGTINTNYLKNSGKYQRVLVLNLNPSAFKSKYYKVSLFHHERSEAGERFAHTLQEIFDRNSLKISKKNSIKTFESSENLYLVKNVVPPITMIDIIGTDNPKDTNRIFIDSRDDLLSRIITNGVLSDYANLSIEE